MWKHIGNYSPLPESPDEGEELKRPVSPNVMPQSFMDIVQQVVEPEYHRHVKTNKIRAQSFMHQPLDAHKRQGRTHKSKY